MNLVPLIFSVQSHCW